MADYLVLTTDLPYFPGKNGHDFFNISHLARSHRVGVVAPYYPSYPDTGVANLEKAVHAAYLWPRPAPPGQLFPQKSCAGGLATPLKLLPSRIKWWLLRRLLGLNHDPEDAYERLAIMSNCAPQLLEAFRQYHWQGIVVIQSSNRPSLDFLPRLGAKCVYFHDVRSDYLKRARPPLPSHVLRKVRDQENYACRQSDAVGFVSDADLATAHSLLSLPDAAGVAPIPVDQSYFTPPPSDWPAPADPTVLFTGHLGHPPNVDAVEYLACEIWPLVATACPEARLVIAGLQPDSRVLKALAPIARSEIHPNVPDIRPFFWNAKVYVVPMRFGGGVRQKIFEAWSMRVPVVCTPMGAEGSGAEHGRHCWLEQEPSAFAQRIISLLRTPPSAVVLDEAAETARRNHSVAVAGACFEQLCQKTLQARRQREFRLLFDLRWMEIGKAGGAEQMSFELIHALSRLDRRNFYTAYIPRSTFNEWDLDPAFHLRPAFCDEASLERESVISSLANRLAELTGRQTILTPEMRSLRAFHRMDFELVHSLCSYAHPDLLSFPQIVTVHDLQHITYPQFFSTEDWKQRDQLYRDSATRAVSLIAISEFTRQELHRHYGIPLEKITTIWNIPSRHVWTPLADSARNRVLARLGLIGPFLFYPAHCWPHKNHARLIEAFILALPRLPRHLRLVFTGRPFPAGHPALKLMQHAEIQARVVHLGYRSPLEMKALFYGCELLVFPSLFEGFGMPVAEAIIAGKPVACSSTTSLPEIAGDAAKTFAPDDALAMSECIVQCVMHAGLRAELAAAAVRRRPLFSARRSAVQTLALYRRTFETVYG